ncbi:MAG TPA: class II glutamine amidotransferase [Pirellulales bacterium]|jgi:glutamine amidotransferase|nr:class II glutamine amidotransferase [Pirellulales bacterium]
MCRHLAVWSRLPVATSEFVLEAENNLRKQACGDHRNEAHGDGWGIGYYESWRSQPTVIKSPGDARSDPAFEAAARSVVAAKFIAHVRQASVGQNTVENCHPFSYGPWLFAHNGTVTNFETIGVAMESDIQQNGADLLDLRHGTTDSELVFLWILNRLRMFGASIDESADLPTVLEKVLSDTLLRLDRLTRQHPPNEMTKFNFLLSDGRHLAATRWGHDLHWCEAPDRIVVASEPIGQAAWQELPEHSILTIDADLRPRINLVS